MKSSLHYQQLMLLVSCLTWFWGEGSSQPREDFFLVKDTSNQQRVSWVAWEEDGKYPNLIIE
jgi:Uma2 family endonuclease